MTRVINVSYTSGREFNVSTDSGEWSFRSPTALSQGKVPPHPLNGSLGGLHSRCSRDSLQKNPYPRREWISIIHFTELNTGTLRESCSELMDSV
jgi:hypothetical protein